jgi:hypothetical protein
LGVYAFWIQPTKKRLIFIAIVVFSYGLYFLIHSYDQFQKRELIVFGNTKGVAVNYFDGINLYEYYADVSEEDLNFKVFPFQSRISYQKKLPLVPIENKNHAVLHLPNLDLALALNKFKKQLSMSSLNEVYIYEEDEWKKTPQMDSLSFLKRAIKIKIND